MDEKIAFRESLRQGLTFFCISTDEILRDISFWKIHVYIVCCTDNSLVNQTQDCDVLMNADAKKAIK